MIVRNEYFSVAGSLVTVLYAWRPDDLVTVVIEPAALPEDGVTWVKYPLVIQMLHQRLLEQFDSTPEEYYLLVAWRCDPDRLHIGQFHFGRLVDESDIEDVDIPEDVLEYFRGCIIGGATCAVPQQLDFPRVQSRRKKVVIR